MSINWKDFLLRSIISILGITFISFGAALSETMNMGLDPFTALNRGASDLLGYSLGNYQLVVNLIILAIVFFVKRDLIGWGTIYNMVLVGYQVNFFNNMFGNFFEADQMSLVVRILITIVAILIFALGVAIYMDMDLGVSPYDAITPMITAKTDWRYSPVRVGQDLVVVITAWLLGGPVGISTVITGFFAGPLIEFFSKKIGQPLDDKIAEAA
ncbi:MAG TPA: hypothetical protein VK048_03365 [Atopostipes sp.]|nr:hypothetical protein [Atopostipes sp.]